MKYEETINLKYFVVLILSFVMWSARFLKGRSEKSEFLGYEINIKLLLWRIVQVKQPNGEWTYRNAIDNICFMEAADFVSLRTLSSTPTAHDAIRIRWKRRWEVRIDLQNSKSPISMSLLSVQGFEERDEETMMEGFRNVFQKIHDRLNTTFFANNRARAWVNGKIVKNTRDSWDEL